MFLAEFYYLNKIKESKQKKRKSIRSLDRFDNLSSEEIESIYGLKKILGGGFFMPRGRRSFKDFYFT